MKTTQDLPPRRALLLGLAGLAACRNDAAPEAPSTAAQSASSAVGAARARRVEIVHDTACPWCRIGCHNLHAAIDALAPQAFEVVYRPYLLDPDAPAEGLDLRENLGKKYGAARVSSMFAGVTEAGAKYGVHFDFDKVRLHPQTAPSHAVIAWAPAAKKRALVTAIHEAYFLGGKNIGDPAALAAIAESVGVDGAAARAAASDPQAIAAVRQQASEAQRSGINGVPHLVVGARSLHGAQPVEAMKKLLAQA